MPSLPALGAKPWKDTLEAWLAVGHNADGTLRSDAAKADVASAVMDGDAAGGALDGTYPSPGLAASVAGNGLAEAANVLSVNVDGTTLEIATDSLRVKAAGITAAHVAADVATQAELDAHVNDALAAHAASAISYVGGTGMSAIDVEAAIDELATEKADAASYQALSGKGALNGYASLDGTGVVPDAQIPAAIARDAEVTSAISTHAGLADPHTVYQKESEKGVANGYASLDASTLVPDAQIPSTIARDTEVTAAVSAHTGLATGAHAASAVSYGGGTGISAVDVEAALDELATEKADATALASYQLTSAKGAVNGYASLDAGGTVPDAQIPAAIARDAEVTSAVSAHTGLATAAHAASAISSAATGDVAALNVQAAIAELASEKATVASLSSYQLTSGKGAANGYASLDASTLVPDAQIPSTITRDSEMTTALGSYQVTSQKGVANGYASLDSGAKVPVAQLPLTAAGASGTLAARPAASAAPNSFYLATDQDMLYFSNGTTWQRVGMPAGATTMVYSNSVPTGWWAYDGTALPASTGIYADLFAHLGTTACPDTRGRLIVPRGTNADVDALGDNDGSALADRTPKHNSSKALTFSGSGGTTGNPSANHTHSWGNWSGGRNAAHFHDMYQRGGAGGGTWGKDATFADGDGATLGIQQMIGENVDHAHYTGGETGTVSAWHTHDYTPSGTIGGTIGPGGTRPIDMPSYVVFSVVLAKL